MRKELMLFASVLAVAASCIRMEKEVEIQEPEQKTVLGEIPVGFDVYTQRSVDTKAGAIGAMTTEKLKEVGMGFGVFAFYTDNNDYDPQSIPNFMYNEKVWWEAAEGFKYETIKYWPNEYGDKAESDDSDKISFFAYAPWVNVVPSTGKIKSETPTDVQWGITGLSRNSATGDPLVKYIASFDAAKSVDLCWGVYNETAWPIIQSGTDQDAFVNGMPWLNVQRPAAIDQKLKFTFKHALSQLYVDVDAFVDGTDNAKPLGDKTKIWVRSISLTGIASKGSLNLNNDSANKALWLDYNGSNDLELGEEITVFDGRKDGKEGVAGAVASNEKLLGLNSALIQDDTEPAHIGVINVPQNLFASTSPIYVIPTGEDIKVTIVYDVETEDNKLATYVSDGKTPGSSVENRISKEIHFAGVSAFENGKSYKIHLHLGMNSVKFDAEITDWVDAEAETDVDLPSNVPVLAALATPSASPVTVTLPGNEQSYQFAISGLNGGEGVTGTAPTAPSNISAVSSNAANASGVAMQVITVAENMTVQDVTSDVAEWKGNASGKGIQVAVKQRAHELGLSASALSDDGMTITLSSTATGTDWSTDVVTSVEISKNGSALTKAAVEPGKFEFTKATGAGAEIGKITLGEKAIAGEHYTITVEAGDAEAETITVEVGGVSFEQSTTFVYYSANEQDFPVTPKVIGPAADVYDLKWSISNPTQVTIDENTGKLTTTLKTSYDRTVTVELVAKEGKEAEFNQYLLSKKASIKLVDVLAQPAEIKADQINFSLSGDKFGPASDTVLAELFAYLNGSLDGKIASNLTYSIEDYGTLQAACLSIVDGKLTALHLGYGYWPETTGTISLKIKVEATSVDNYQIDELSKTFDCTISYTVE